MANPDEWGPSMWKIIHTTSLSLGKQTLPMLQQDEIHALKQFIKQLGLLIPCKVCRSHYLQYSRTHKINYKYSELKQSVAFYFWNLHSEINASNGKPNIEFNDLEELYNKYDISIIMKDFNVIFKKYILQRIIAPDNYNDFLKSFVKLYTIININ